MNTTDLTTAQVISSVGILSETGIKKNDYTSFGSRLICLFSLLFLGISQTLFAQMPSMCKDTAKPVARCKPSTIFLDAKGTASLTIKDVNNNSTDDCGIDSLWLGKTIFTCKDLGMQGIYFYVRDSVKNIDSCLVSVTVRDTLPPSVFCQNTTIYLDTAGVVLLKPDVINNGSTDNCSLADMSLNRSTFNCLTIGVHDVILTVKDSSKNVSHCTAKLTVRDTTPPSVICPSDIVKTLNSGACETAVTFSVTALDNCSITLKQTMGLSSGSLFSIGTNAIAFEAKDIAGNVTFCAFYVRIFEYKGSGQMVCRS